MRVSGIGGNGFRWVGTMRHATTVALAAITLAGQAPVNSAVAGDAYFGSGPIQYEHELGVDSSCEPAFRGGDCHNYCFDLWNSYCWERPHGHAFSPRHLLALRGARIGCGGSHQCAGGSQGCTGGCGGSCEGASCAQDPAPYAPTTPMPSAPVVQPAPPTTNVPDVPEPAEQPAAPDPIGSAEIPRADTPAAVDAELPRSFVPTETLETDLPGNALPMEVPEAAEPPTPQIPTNPIPVNPLPDFEQPPFDALPPANPVPPLPADLSTSASVDRQPPLPVPALSTTSKERVIHTASGKRSSGTTRLLKQLEAVSR